MGTFTEASGESKSGYFSQGRYFETEYLFNLSSLFEQEPKFDTLKPEQIALWKRVGKFKLEEYVSQGKLDKPTESQGRIGLMQDDTSVYYGQIDSDNG